MSSSATLNQVHYRIRTDTGAADATPTWAAVEDVSVSLAVETTFRIRFVVQNTGTASGAGPFILRVSKNSGTYTAVTASSGATLGAQSADASSDIDATVINTLRLTAGAGTGVQGVYDETGSTTYSLVAGTYVEWEFGLILKTAGATAGDTFDFRIYNNTTAFATYTRTPRVVAAQSGTNFNTPSYKASATLGNLGWYGNYNAAGRSSVTIPLESTEVGSAAGDLVLVAYVTDNATTSDADASVVTSVTDTKGNTYSKAKDWQFGSPGVQAGTSVGLWYSNTTVALVAYTDTITLNLSSSSDRDAFGAIATNISMTAGKVAAVEATNTSASTLAAAVLPSLNATTSNIECLRVRVSGSERNSFSSWAANHTSGWTFEGEIGGNSGTSATSQVIQVEYRISTGTGAASAPTGSVTADQASVYVAFRADAAFSGHVLLANDVSSASSVTRPAVQQVHGILANDVKSNSSVTQPAVKQLQGLAATDVLSASNVANPALTAAITVPSRAMHQYGMRRA